MAKKRVFRMVVSEDDAEGFTALSFVDQPAIDENFIALHKQYIMLEKFNEEKRVVTGPVLIPDQLILRKHPVTGQEFYIYFDRETIEQFGSGLMKKGKNREFSVMHQKPVNDCWMSQIWIKDFDMDKSVALGFDLPVGTLFVTSRIENQEVRERIKSGELKGYSIEAIMNQVDASLMSMELTDEESDLIADIEAAIVNS